MQMWYVGRCQQGMSLVQVVIAVGIMTAMGLIVASQMVQLNRTVTFVQNKGSLVSLSSSIVSTISDAAACLAAISNPPQTYNIGQGASATGFPVRIRLPGGEVVQNGAILSSFDRLNINNLVYKNANLISTLANGQRVFLGNLELSATSTQEVSGPSGFRPRVLGSLFLFVAPGTNQIVACSSSNSPSLANVCSSFGGTFDATTGKCINATFGNGCINIPGFPNSGTSPHLHVRAKSTLCGGMVNNNAKDIEQCINGTWNHILNTCGI